MENKINAERNEIKHTAHSTYRYQELLCKG